MQYLCKLPSAAIEMRRRIARYTQFQPSVGLAIATVATLGLATLLVAWAMLDPAPPAKIRLATGVADGFYDQLGRKFRDSLQAEGVSVELVSTRGALDNVDLLLQDNGIDFAFVQGGIIRKGGAGYDGLRTLASLAIEPLWIFSRQGRTFEGIDSGSQTRVAVGEIGSGTRDLVLHLIDLMGRRDDVVLVEIGGPAAATALRAGEVDFVAYVTSPTTPWVQALLKAPGIVLAEPTYTRALARALNFTNEIELPARVLDFERRIPEKDLTVLGVATSLVVTPKAHPAIKQLLLSKAHLLVSGQRVLGTSGQFPSTRLVDHELDEEAVRFFQYGPTPVRRYLPYWLANLVERFWIIIVPLLTVALPAFGFGPRTLDWRMRRRIYRWYRELAAIETNADKATTAKDLNDALRDLDRLQSVVKTVHVSLPYRRELYALRSHIALVRQTIISTSQTQRHHGSSAPLEAD